MSQRITKWLTLGLAMGTGAVSAALYLGWVKPFMATDRCLDAGGVYETDWAVCNRSEHDSPSTHFTGPVYAGTLRGQDVRLQLRDDTQSYRMIEDGQRVIGDLNTERGFQQDDNAVVFVLNPSADEARQVRLLRARDGQTDTLQLIGPGASTQPDSVLRAQRTAPG